MSTTHDDERSSEIFFDRSFSSRFSISSVVQSRASSVEIKSQFVVVDDDKNIVNMLVFVDESFFVFCSGEFGDDRFVSNRLDRPGTLENALPGMDSDANPMTWGYIL